MITDCRGTLAEQLDARDDGVVHANRHLGRLLAFVAGNRFGRPAPQSPILTTDK